MRNPKWYEKSKISLATTTIRHPFVSKFTVHIRFFRLLQSSWIADHSCSYKSPNGLVLQLALVLGIQFAKSSFVRRKDTLTYRRVVVHFFCLSVLLVLLVALNIRLTSMESFLCIKFVIRILFSSATAASYVSKVDAFICLLNSKQDVLVSTLHY